MTARDELYNYADDANLGGEYLDELLDRVEREAKTAGDLDQRRELRCLELLEGSLIDYINRADTPAMVGHVLTGMLALANNQASEEAPGQ
ncbi:hypothetical protein [Streptomyces sp. NBC_00568]|uniref:hypothetical protein n=1 Tax=Streptomyces sp. NBC_00568 TaxID=2975779 RepID=UPI002256E93E|nr:hypothetical protein [Streptomyces sp. NBC_00568]MCX4993432.1 hypothetical protein [Streptomyces sp. NBC_00568]